MLAVLLPILLEALEDGTLVELAEAIVKLIQVLIPLVENPKTRATLVDAVKRIEAAGVKPAAVESPAMEHAASRTGMGGR